MSKTDTPMDFSKYLLSPTGRVEINLPNGDPMLYEGQRVAVNVYSPASREYAKAEAELQRTATSRLMGKKIGDDNDEADARFLVAITESIENFPYPGGIGAVYRDRGLIYIGQQVRAYVGEQGNFFAKSGTS